MTDKLLDTLLRITNKLKYGCIITDISPDIQHMRDILITQGYIRRTALSPPMYERRPDSSPICVKCTWNACWGNHTPCSDCDPDPADKEPCIGCGDSCVCDEEDLCNRCGG